NTAQLPDGSSESTSDDKNPRQVHSDSLQSGQSLQSRKGTGLFTAAQFMTIGENLNAEFSDIANITVSGNSISIGKILLVLKKLWNEPEPKYVISGSIQKYGNVICLVSKLKSAGEKLIICEVHKEIQKEDEIPDLIRDLAFKIWKDIPKTWK